MYAKMKKSLGSKRVLISDEQIAEIVKVYSVGRKDVTFETEFKEAVKANAVVPTEPEASRIVSRIFENRFFGYRKVTVDRPLAAGKEGKFKKGEKPYDKDLRDTENVPLTESIDAYFKREVLPHVPDAWVNKDIKDEKDGLPGKVGFELNFNRYFYVYKPPRKPAVIAAEIQDMEKRFLELMKGVVA